MLAVRSAFTNLSRLALVVGALVALSAGLIRAQSTAANGALEGIVSDTSGGILPGVTVTVKVAHLRLCHSRMMFARAYMRESQEMVFDAHDRAFVFLKGACTRGIYDNMKTAVEAIFSGKERQYNRRFLQMCSHYLVQPPSIELGPMAPQ